MQITRHFVDVGTRRVHYRRCGDGPPLIMIHQSPRSSAEYAPLMRQWGTQFTCLALDTPGFGQSDALPGTPDIDDFADALVATLDALGLDKVAAYGFHSGGIILVAALKRHPDRFHGLAVGGYAVWTDDEMRVFAESYLPPFQPTAYGEHLTWLWNRILEQSWVFPWFDVRDATRLSGAHDDPVKVNDTVMDMLAAGDAYRAGYGAVLSAPRDVPTPDSVTPPVLITAYDGDPLQAHIDRLGLLPASWLARKVATPADQQAASLAFLAELAQGSCPVLAQAEDEGFVTVTTTDFDGQLHWRGAHVDLPGFGLSDDWPGTAPETWAPWQAVIDALDRPVTLEPLPRGGPDKLYPDFTPDRFGSHLARAWGIARARALFDPWYAANARHERPIDAATLDPDALARDTLSILRAHAAKAFHIARQQGGC
ncbi:Haloalkane dehalogenase [Sphingomonas antarctica]|uniref:alpha/beta hydrolase n=1 Tax=Sphingomonas antarctica TaxID=2040274 RepID=UPI0039E9E485